MFSVRDLFKRLVFISVLLAFLMAPSAYAYFDALQLERNVSVSIGAWEVGERFVFDENDEAHPFTREELEEATIRVNGIEIITEGVFNEGAMEGLEEDDIIRDRGQFLLIIRLEEGDIRFFGSNDNFDMPDGVELEVIL